MPASSPDSSDGTAARILEAARRVFVHRGTAGARTQEIADEAGVNKALLHYYFKSKANLSQAVFLDALGALMPRLFAVLAADLPLAEKLEQAVGVELDILEANPYLPGYVLAEFQYHPERMRTLVTEAAPTGERRRHVFAALQRQLDAEAGAGRIRPTRADDLFVSLISLLVFPFAAAPMLDAVFGLDRDGLDALAARRRADLPAQLLRAISPD